MFFNYSLVLLLEIPSCFVYVFADVVPHLNFALAASLVSSYATAALPTSTTSDATTEVVGLSDIAFCTLLIQLARRRLCLQLSVESTTTNTTRPYISHFHMRPHTTDSALLYACQCLPASVLSSSGDTCVFRAKPETSSNTGVDGGTKIERLLLVASSCSAMLSNCDISQRNMLPSSLRQILSNPANNNASAISTTSHRYPQFIPLSMCADDNMSTLSEQSLLSQLGRCRLSNLVVNNGCVTSAQTESRLEFMRRNAAIQDPETTVSNVAIVLPATTDVISPIPSAVFLCEDYEKCVLTQMQEAHGRRDLTPEKIRQQAIVALMELVDSRCATD